MSSQFRILPAADRDLDELAAYLARQASVETSFRFYDAVAATFERLARMPGIGEPWYSSKSRLAQLRVWRIDGFENHVVFYRPNADGIEIVRVLHGARDADNTLRADLLN